MKTVLRLGLAMVLFSAPAFASDIALFAGVQSPGKITLTNAAAAGSSGASAIITNPANVGTFGVRYGHGSLWGGEHTLAFNTNFLDSNSKAFFYNSNVRIQAPLPLFKPYGTAGVGTVISWGSGASDIGSKFALNYGGGVKVMPGPVGVEFDLRGYTLPKVQGQTLNMIQASLAVVFGH